MLKKIALPVVALVALLILASAPAKAAVRFGITVGPPVYTYPAYPYYQDPYVTPYVDPYAYSYNYYYTPAPTYVYPYRSWNRGFNNFRDHERHERLEHQQRELREHYRR
jgi:hypothetical protein